MNDQSRRIAEQVKKAGNVRSSGALLDLDPWKLIHAMVMDVIADATPTEISDEIDRQILTPAITDGDPWAQRILKRLFVGQQAVN